MNDTPTPPRNTFTDQVLEKIRSGKVHMHPRIYFGLKALALALTTAAVVAASATLVSFILFSIQASGQMYLLGFGGRGLQVFLLLFPWWLLALDIALMLLMGWLLRHFQFGYRSPLLYLLTGTLAISVIIGFLITITPLHRSLLHQANRGRLPVFGGLYENLRRPPRERGVFRGEVTDIVPDNSFIMRHNDFDTDHDDGGWKVIPPPNIQIQNFLHVHDYVFVAGNEMNGVIQAYGIQKLPTPEVDF